ncbi:MAG: magnesium transporter [Candidatus Promineifilaceae bacterium]|nr:magnesium transporter [Candidatus Promineifilaceae bacterium]
METTTQAYSEELRFQIEQLLDEGKHDQVDLLLASLHPADIADLLDELGPEHAVVVFGMLSTYVASEVLDETGSLVRQELVEQVDDEHLADLLEELPMDDAAEFLDQLPTQTATRLLELMEPDEALEVRELLNYEDETAGRLMTRDVAAFRRHWTAAQAIEYLRQLVQEDQTETIHYLYVIDRYSKLIGVVPIRALLLAPPTTTIESIMVPDVITIEVTADQERLAEIVSKYDFVAIPVVDHENHLLGVATVDDVLDVLEEEATEDIQRLGGSEPLTRPYFSASVFEMVGKRLVWLLPLFAASVVTDTVVSTFGTLMAAFVSLTIFIPVVSGTGGNAGSQTVATVIRALAVGDIRLVDVTRVWLREATVGLVLGLVLGAAGFVRALLFDADPGVPLVLGLTLPLVVIWANSVATLVPIIAERFHIDPTVVSAPMITTIVDASGLFIYLYLASRLLV